eukprot:1285632-Prymnesium_polylepis.1
MGKGHLKLIPRPPAHGRKDRSQVVRRPGGSQHQRQRGGGHLRKPRNFDATTCVDTVRCEYASDRVRAPPWPPLKCFCEYAGQWCAHQEGSRSPRAAWARITKGRPSV